MNNSYYLYIAVNLITLGTKSVGEQWLFEHSCSCNVYLDCFLTFNLCIVTNGLQNRNFMTFQDTGQPY